MYHYCITDVNKPFTVLENIYRLKSVRLSLCRLINQFQTDSNIQHCVYFACVGAPPLFTIRSQLPIDCAFKQIPLFPTAGV